LSLYQFFNFKKMKTIGLTFVLLFAAGILYAGDYAVDISRSSVKWLGKKVTGEHTGTISIKSGQLNVKNGDITGGTIEIDMNTITDLDLKDAEWNARLVGHLKSDDFFAVEKFPVSTFRLTGVKKLSGNESEFSGNLTIKGITHPVTFRATVTTEGNVLTSAGQLVINRAKFNIRYGSGSFFQGLGDKMIYDEFTLDFNLVASE